MFKAYPMTRDGRRLPGVKLDTPEEIWRYFKVQSKINPTVVVVDEMDMVVAKMENGKLVFPKVEGEIDFTKEG